MIDEEMLAAAAKLLEACRRERLTVALAESCTGGLIAATLTEIPGSSAVLECAYVTYSNKAKETALGVPRATLTEHGAVSAETVRSMAVGALKASSADLSAAVTGIAGPGGGSAAKPVGLVHFAAARRGGAMRQREMRFGDLGRDEIRRKSVLVAFEMLEGLI